MKNRQGLIFVLFLIFFLGCLLKPIRADENDEQDPLEPFNRVMFSVNEFIEGLVLRPAALFYHMAVPHHARSGVSNFFENLTLPLQALAYFLSGDGERGINQIVRFIGNSTFGVGGFIDASEVFSLPKYEDFDFDKTLAKWDVPAGPYLMTPLIGGGTFRHLATFTLETACDPVNIVGNNLIDKNFRTYRSIGQSFLKYADTVERYGSGEALRKKIDFYTSVREAYFQKRNKGQKSVYESPKISMED